MAAGALQRRVYYSRPGRSIRPPEGLPMRTPSIRSADPGAGALRGAWREARSGTFWGGAGDCGLPLAEELPPEAAGRHGGGETFPNGRIGIGMSALLIGALLGASRAGAAPLPGERLPQVMASDVTGRTERLQALLGTDRTLLVAITDRSASQAMRAWFDTATARAPAGVARISVISLGLPFFVSQGVAQRKARGEVPQQFWHASLLDTHHQMAGLLGLAVDGTPYAFVLAEDGRVLASVHGLAGSPDAEAVWRALSSRRPVD